MERIFSQVYIHSVNTHTVLNKKTVLGQVRADPAMHFKTHEVVPLREKTPHEVHDNIYFSFSVFKETKWKTARNVTKERKVLIRF